MSVGVVTLLGLIPSGLASNRAALSRTEVVNISSAILADLRLVQTAGEASPRFKIPVPAPGSQNTMTSGMPHILYFSGQASSSGDLGAGPGPDSRYRVTVGFAPPISGRKTATQVRVQVSPFAPSEVAEAWPKSRQGAVETIVSLNIN